jgi:hypothetical protein
VKIVSFPESLVEDSARRVGESESRLGVDRV